MHPPPPSPGNTYISLHTGSKVLIKEFELSRTLLIRFLYALYDTIRFSYDTVRFSYDTIRFSYDTIQCDSVLCSHDTIRFWYDTKVLRFSYTFWCSCAFQSLYKLKNLLPDTRFCWSWILPRTIWRYSENTKDVNFFRKKNKEVHMKHL